MRRSQRSPRPSLPRNGEICDATGFCIDNGVVQDDTACNDGSEATLNAGNGFSFDDVTVEIVPEPSTALLLALGLLGLARRRWLVNLAAPGSCRLTRLGGQPLAGKAKITGHPKPFHDLRHTFATDLLLAGVPILKVSRWLGHTSIQITCDTCGHLLPDPGEHGVVDALEQLEVRPLGEHRPASPLQRLVGQRLLTRARSSCYVGTALCRRRGPARPA